MKCVRVLTVLAVVVVALAAVVPLAYAASAVVVPAHVSLAEVHHMYLNGTYQSYTFPTTIAGLLSDANDSTGAVFPLSYMITIIGALTGIVVLFFLWRHAKGRGAA